MSPLIDDPKRSGIPIAIVMLVLAINAIGWRAADGPDDVTFTERERRIMRSMTALGPVPPDFTNRVSDDPAAARLGQSLFFDPRLSGNGSVSCATCHDPALAFADGRALPEGIDVGERNTPSLLNVAYQRWWFWDGRADSLWAQALQPLERDIEMNFDRLGVAHLLHDDAKLHQAYERVFGALPALDDAARFPAHAKPMTDATDDARHVAWVGMANSDREAINVVFANVGKAIAAYERRLVSRQSVFDRFVDGLEASSSADPSFSLAARRGLKLFIGDAGCRNCHHGPLMSDLEFHNIGVAADPKVPGIDTGRLKGLATLRADPFNAAGGYGDAPNERGIRRLDATIDGPELWGQFKVPSLRNVALTNPYMHQGQFQTLGEVLDFYSTREGAMPPGHHQEQILEPLNLSPEEIEDLIAFLESLTDLEIEPGLLKMPPSPLLTP